MLRFQPSRGAAATKSPWTEEEIGRIRAAWKDKVPYSELEPMFPGRTLASITAMAARLRLGRGTEAPRAEKKQTGWTQAELDRLRNAWGARVPYSDLEPMFPGRTRASIVTMAARLGLDRGSAEDEYVSMKELQRQSKMSYPTLVSIFEYASLYDKPVRTEGSPPREVYHLKDAEHAILRWIDLMSLRQYSEYIDRPYSTLQAWMRRAGLEFQPDVPVGFRRLHPVEWARAFDGKLEGLDFMFRLIPVDTMK